MRDRTYPRRIGGRLVGTVCSLVLASTPTTMPASAQSAPNLTNAQRWKILDCYSDTAWDSSACSKLGVTKRGEFFYGPLGTTNSEDPAFNPELGELLTDCRDVEDEYCAKDEGAPAEPSEQAQASDPRAGNRWLAQSNETQQGTLCTVGVKEGNVIVGFTAVNDSEYRGFAVGLIAKATRATWRIDETQPFVVDGKRSASGGWLTEPLRPEVLAGVAGGRELAVTSSEGERIVVGLAKAKEAVAAFNACRRNGPPRVGNVKGSGSAVAAKDGISPLSDREPQAGQFIAALDALRMPPSGQRSPDENLSPRDVVDEAHRIYEEMLDLPSTEAGIAGAWALEKRLRTIESAAIGMRNSPDWEALFEVFFKQGHLFGQAISDTRNDIAGTVRKEAPQRLDALRAEADHLAGEYSSKIAGFDVNDDVLDSVIVLRATLFGETPLAWLTARQWVALAIKQSVAKFIDVQTTTGGVAIVMKDTGKPSFTYLFSSDYGELYLSGVRAGDEYVGVRSGQERLQFETLLGEVVGYRRP